MIEPDKVIDNMMPALFRFNKYGEFSEDILPATKLGEEYIIVRQSGKEKKYIVDDELETYRNDHYYIINDESQVIGRFDVGGNMDLCGITYHIVEEFQNRGIGQVALMFVVDDIFSRGVGKIRILAEKKRSIAIASKVGFTQKSERLYEMKSTDYQQLKQNSRTI